MIKYLFFFIFTISCNNPDTKFDQGYLGASSSNKNQRIPVDQIDDDNSIEGFGGGIHTGTSSSTGKLEVTTNINLSTLDKSWAPKWNNIIAYWKFENNLNDSSESTTTHSLNAFNGALVSTAQKKIQNYAAFVDGTNDYFMVNNHNDFNFGNSNFSIQIWVYPLQNCTGWDNVWIINKWKQGGATPGQNEWSLGACGASGNSNNFSFAIEDGTTTYSTYNTEKYILNKWYHVVATRESSLLKLYVNGKLEDQINIGTVSINNLGNNIIIGGSNHFSIFSRAYYDEAVIWNDSISAEDVNHLYSRQKSSISAHFTSRIIDGVIERNWNNLKSKTPLPFSKEITGDSDGDNSPDNEISDDYSEISGTLMSGLRGFWTFNESLWSGTSEEIRDISGNGLHMTASGGATNTETFNSKAVYIDGSTGKNISLGSSMNTSNIKNNFTYSFWAKPDKAIDNTTQSTSGTLGTAGENYIIYPQNGNVLGDSAYSGAGVSIGTNGIGVFEHSQSYMPGLLFQATQINDWTHIAIVYTNKQPSLYINGQFIKTGLTSTKSEVHAIISDLGGSYYGKYKGYVDDLGVWDRSLSAIEIKELYRRSANRLKYQIRSCDDNACVGEAWLGPDGTTNSYFSELLNRKTAGVYDSNGPVQIDSLSLFFPDFYALNDNRYFQYRVIMESDDISNLCGGSPCLPSIESIEIGPAR